MSVFIRMTFHIDTPRPKQPAAATPPIAGTFDNTVTCISILIGLALLAGCGFTPQKLPYADPQAQQLLRATEAASTNRFRFTPVSSQFGASDSLRDQSNVIGGWLPSLILR